MKQTTNLPLEFKFAPTEEFIWEREYPDEQGNIVEKRVIGHYFPGMTYNCTRQPVHDALREKCREWAAAGRIVVIPLGLGQRFEVKPVSQAIADAMK